MSDGKKIVVEKTLHLENARVVFIGYTSNQRPSMVESIRIEKKGFIRTSGDNGRTWEIREEWNWKQKLPNGHIARRDLPSFYLDPDNDILTEFTMQYEEPAEDYVMTFGPEVTNAPLPFVTSKIYYRFSRDNGKTWSVEKQLIQKGAGYDQVHWADGVYYGKNSAYLPPLHIVKLPDGTLVQPVYTWVLQTDGQLQKFPDWFGSLAWPNSSAACLLGRWREDLSDIDWQVSNQLTVPEYLSFGLDEAAVAPISDGVLMMVMRGSSVAWQTMPGVKFFSISKDGGCTWGPAVPLCYPDGKSVYSPASLPDFFRSSRNGRVYLITNILPGPTRQSDPRYPLQIAEVDGRYSWVMPETVTIIDDRQEHHPRFVRFSNWARMEDRETGNQVLYMTEARIDSMFDDVFPGGTISPHSFRYEIRLSD